MAASEVCKICEQDTQPFGQGRVLQRYDVSYFRCPQCGFIQTESPYWLSEAYSDAIVFSDVGLVGRNLECAQVTRAVIRLLFDRHARFLDYGGGYGLLVRLMRDQGYDFYRYDRWCQNLFARGFDDGDVAGGSYALVTAFEVFEHLPQPLDDIRQMLTFSRNLLFSTLLVPDPPPPPASWWYYALEGGQHVALYSRTALERLAARLGLHLATYRQRWHLLTENAKAARRFGWACWVGRSRWLQPLWRSKRSLLAQDYERLTGRPLS